MTTSLNSTAFTAAVAALSITGITFYDTTGIPDAITYRSTLPAFFPLEEWLGAGKGSPTADSTFGPAASRSWQAERVFHYLYIHSVAGEGRGLRKKYQAAAQNLEAIWAAVLQINLANTEVMNFTHTRLGSLTETRNPSSSQFIGCFVDIDVREWINP